LVREANHYHHVLHAVARLPLLPARIVWFSLTAVVGADLGHDVAAVAYILDVSKSIGLAPTDYARNGKAATSTKTIDSVGERGSGPACGP
jgi:hypothetical protein